MGRMRFPKSWIRGVAAHYTLAHSQVLLASGKGERFSMSRSVKRRYLLAPTLSSFFTKAMSSFLAAWDTRLHGLWMPVQGGVIGC